MVSDAPSFRTDGGETGARQDSDSERTDTYECDGCGREVETTWGGLCWLCAEEQSNNGGKQTVRTKVAELNETGKRAIEQLEAELEPTSLEIARNPPSEPGPILMAQLERSETEGDR